jgi:glycosyltransferase involved in cell wall biosynthesis
LTPPEPPGGDRVKVVRVIGRLNVGGPGIQAITLSSRLRARGYDTVLVRGREGPREGSLDDLAATEGVAPLRVGTLRREIGPLDLRALTTVLRVLRREAPDIVHTHAAKGGAVGRVAALLAGRTAPRVLVHTFHGHVLDGYFSPAKVALFTRVERWLARRTTRLIAVSDEVRQDLIDLRIAPPEKISVVPLGFELERFLIGDEQRELRGRAWRRERGIPEDVPLVLLVARLVPIKRVDRFLRVAQLLAGRCAATFAVAGDGELREVLRASEAAGALGERLAWLDFEADVAPALFGADVVVQTSDNEGTPVSLIEAHAAGRPVVSTRVGGVAAVVRDGVSGHLAAVDDEPGFAAAIEGLLADVHRAAAFGRAGRDHVTSAFTLDRLVENVDRLYRELLSAAQDDRP